MFGHFISGKTAFPKIGTFGYETTLVQ